MINLSDFEEIWFVKSIWTDNRKQVSKKKTRNLLALSYSVIIFRLNTLNE
jgi:hypothetical protein